MYYYKIDKDITDLLEKEGIEYEMDDNPFFFSAQKIYDDCLVFSVGDDTLQYTRKYIEENKSSCILRIEDHLNQLAEFNDDVIDIMQDVYYDADDDCCNNCN